MKPRNNPTEEPACPESGVSIINKEILDGNSLKSLGQTDSSLNNSLSGDSNVAIRNDKTVLEHSTEQESSSKPLDISPGYDITRKRSLEADEEKKAPENAPVSDSVRNTSKRQNDVLRRPPERPTSLLLPLPSGVCPVKRPSFLPIPSQFVSPQLDNCNNSTDFAKTTGSSFESRAVCARTIVSGRRVLQNSQTLLGSSLRIPFESQARADSRPEVETVWEPLSPKDLGTCAPPRAPDHLATSCMLCSARFSLIRARQHCRACGRIVCALCCTRWTVLPYLVPPVPDLEQPTVGGGSDTTSQDSPISNLTVAGPPVFQRSYSSPERYSRVCELCYGVLARSPTKPEVSSFIQPPSPKRQRSIPPAPSSSPSLLSPSSSVSIRPTMTSSDRSDFLIDVSKVDLKLSSQCRSEDLLHPLHPVYEDTNQKSDSVEEEQWPPLVVGLHAKLSLRRHPPKSVLLAKLFSKESTFTDMNCRDAKASPSGVCSADCPRLSTTTTTTTDTNPVAPSPRSPVSPSLTFRNPPLGITLALTRNVHLCVHATELSCCLRKPAWCFASFGLQAFGQQEVVLIVQRRPGEELPPLCIYRFYQRLYLAVSQQQSSPPPSQQQQQQKRQSTDIVAPDTIALIPSNQSRPYLFRPYDTFIPNAVPGIQNGDRGSVNSIKYLDDPTGILFGCLFFPPTHQCLQGLHLPSAPFLIGHFFYQSEAYWAKYLPLRVLLRLGKSMRHYPTPLLCDLDREPVFHFDKGTGWLPWLSSVANSPLPVIMGATNQLETSGPPLLLRIPGLQIRLASSPRSDTQMSGPRLELLFPVRSHTRLVQFLETLPSSCTGFVLAGDLDPEADSHLVCVQTDSSDLSPDLAASLSPTSHRSFSSSAISIANTTRAFTGASFASFSSDARYTTVRIVEDGVVVQLSRDAFTQFACSLSTMNDVRFEVPSLALKDSLVSSVSIRWTGQKDNGSPMVPTAFVPWKLNRKSWIDMQCVPVEYTYLVPVSYQLVHWLNLYTWPDSTPSNSIAFPFADPESGCKLAWARFHVLESIPRSIVDLRTGMQLNLGELANQACGAVVQSLRSHIDDLRRYDHTQLAVRIQMKPPDQVGYQVASLRSELDVLIPHSPGDVDTNETIRSPKSTTGFSPSTDPCDCTFDLERYLTPVIQSWLSWMRFDAAPMDSPSSFSSFSPAARTPTGPRSVSSLSDSASTPDCSPQLVVELDFYLLD